MNLFKYDKNVTVDCYGYGKPLPKITWIRHKTEIPTVYNFTDKDRKKVVQEIFQSSKESPWKVTSRLYLRLDGVTYQDAGNYTCEVFNGVGGNISASDTLQVFCKEKLPRLILSNIRKSNTEKNCYERCYFLSLFFASL